MVDSLDMLAKALVQLTGNPTIGPTCRTVPRAHAHAQSALPSPPPHCARAPAASRRGRPPSLESLSSFRPRRIVAASFLLRVLCVAGKYKHHVAQLRLVVDQAIDFTRRLPGPDDAQRVLLFLNHVVSKVLRLLRRTARSRTRSFAMHQGAGSAGGTTIACAS